MKRCDVVRATDWVSRIISRFGEAAKVKVDEKGAKVKFASAHDLRRAFGARWSTRVMPAVLQQLMRHESIDTTMKYYVGQNAEAMADAVWATVAKSLPSSLEVVQESKLLDQFHE
jgi:integrase